MAVWNALWNWVLGLGWAQVVIALIALAAAGGALIWAKRLLVNASYEKPSTGVVIGAWALRVLGVLLALFTLVCVAAVFAPLLGF